MNRRTFLEISSTLTAMPFFMGADNPHYQKGKIKVPSNEKAVIMIFLDGGISHIDFTHSHPDLINGKHSVNGSIPTKTQGLYFGGDWQELSKVTDKLSVVHSYRHSIPNHSTGKYWNLTGYQSTREPQEYPSFGSVISKMLGPTNSMNGLPVYMRTQKVDGDDTGYVGSAYRPFDANDNGTKDLIMKLGNNRFAQRLRMLQSIDKKMDLYHDRSLDAMKALRSQAVSMITGNLKELFEISNEPENMRETYGKNQIGDSLLLARRLVENGGKFINVVTGGWDLHTNISNGMKQRVPPVDKAVTALINDLHQRGLSKNVLVVINTDFGRTISINNNLGRDHHASLISLVLAGGDYEHGRIIGKAERDMAAPFDNELRPKDLAHTIFDHFGIQNVQITDNESRPRWLYDKQSKNILV